MCTYKKIHENKGKVSHASILLTYVSNMKLIYEMCTHKKIHENNGKLSYALILISYALILITYVSNMN